MHVPVISCPMESVSFTDDFFFFHSTSAGRNGPLDVAYSTPTIMMTTRTSARLAERIATRKVVASGPAAFGRVRFQVERSTLGGKMSGKAQKPAIDQRNSQERPKKTEERKTGKQATPR